MNSLWALAFLIAVAPCLLILGYKISKRNGRRGGKASAAPCEKPMAAFHQETPAPAVKPPQSIQDPDSLPLWASPKAFDVLDEGTWASASDDTFIWNGRTFYISLGEVGIATEKDITKYMGAVLQLYEYDNEMNQKMEKLGRKKIIEHMFNNLLDGMDFGKGIKEAIHWICTGDTNVPFILSREANLQQFCSRFNPRDPETYQYATDNPLVIDGVSIYHEYTDCQDGRNDVVRDPVSEKYFVRSIFYELKIQKNIQSDADYQKFIESHIDTSLLLCSPMPPKVKTAGGYGFTAAQLEILGEIADNELTAIGKVMSGGLYGGRLEQALFNSCGSLNRDWHFLAALHGKHKNTEEEKRVMREYFLYDNGRFETEEEVHQFFDSSEYLKLRPRLKKEMVEDALYWINGGSNEKN